MRLGIAAICGVLVTAASWAAQDKADAPLVSTEIVAIIGSDVDSRTVISKVLTHAMAERQPREFFLASQIRTEWLPVVKGVEFVRLPNTEVRGFLSGCGSYWIITDLQRTQKNVIAMRLHQKCGGTTLGYSVSLDGSEWQVRQTGIGSGIPMPQPDCPCVGP